MWDLGFRGFGAKQTGIRLSSLDPALEAPEPQVFKLIDTDGSGSIDFEATEAVSVASEVVI